MDTNFSIINVRVLFDVPPYSCTTTFSNFFFFFFFIDNYAAHFEGTCAAEANGGSIADTDKLYLTWSLLWMF